MAGAGVGAGGLDHTIHIKPGDRFGDAAGDDQLAGVVEDDMGVIGDGTGGVAEVAGGSGVDGQAAGSEFAAGVGDERAAVDDGAAVVGVRGVEGEHARTVLGEDAAGGGGVWLEQLGDRDVAAGRHIELRAAGSEPRVGQAAEESRAGGERAQRAAIEGERGGGAGAAGGGEGWQRDIRRAADGHSGGVGVAGGEARELVGGEHAAG